MRLRVSMLAACALLIGRGADAQPVADDFEKLPLNSPVVYVVPEHGAETRGRLMAFDPDSLTLSIDGRRIVFQREGILRLYRRGDSVRNGMAWGALVGVVGSVGFAAGRPMSGCDSFSAGMRHGCSVVGKFFVWLITAPAGLAAGLAVGAAIDRLIVGRTLIYERPADASLRGSRRRLGSVSLVPVVTPQEKGLAMSIRW